MKTAVYKIKRLFNHFASLRGTTVDLCINRGANLKIVYNGQFMTIPLAKLKDPNKFQVHKRMFQSKYNPGQKYELYDFLFTPDGYNNNMDGSKSDKEKINDLYEELRAEYDKVMENFVPEFGNKDHVCLIAQSKKIKTALKKLGDYKASVPRAKILYSDTKRMIGTARLLR